MTFCMKTKALKQWPQAEWQIKDIDISRILETGTKSTEGTYTGSLRKELPHGSPKRGREIQDTKLQPEFKGNPDCNFDRQFITFFLSLSQASQMLLTTLLKFQIQSMLRGRPEKLTELQNGSRSQTKHQRRTGEVSSWSPWVIGKTPEAESQTTTAQKTTTWRELPSRLIWWLTGDIPIALPHF